MYEWAEEINCAVTVCNTEGVILFMNKKSKETFAKHGDMVGKNLMSCHNPKSIEKIREMLATGGSNTYTIEKEGVKKMIYQTVWKKNGTVAGLVEISMVLPDTIPHRIRK